MDKQATTMERPTRQLLTEREFSEEYGFAETTLRVWRSRGRGPAWIKVSEARSGAIRYRRSAIDAWLDERTVTPAAD